MLHFLEVQLLVHITGNALWHHDRQGHGLVLLKLLAIGVLEALDEAKAIAVLHAGTAADFGSILLGTPVAELLEAVLDRMLGGAEASGRNNGILAFTDEDETGAGYGAATGPIVIGAMARLACSSGNGSSWR